jgi:hypothetical protein
MQKGRDARTERILGRLVIAGLLDGGSRRRSLAAPDRDPADRLELHARAAMAPLLPVCTPSGRRKLDALIDRRS